MHGPQCLILRHAHRYVYRQHLLLLVLLVLVMLMLLLVKLLIPLEAMSFTKALTLSRSEIFEQRRNAVTHNDLCTVCCCLGEMSSQILGLKTAPTCLECVQQGPEIQVQQITKHLLHSISLLAVACCQAFACTVLLMLYGTLLCAVYSFMLVQAIYSLRQALVYCSGLLEQ
jgi:hypothetical protein